DACEHGQMFACIEYTNMIIEGGGVYVDYKEAREILEGNCSEEAPAVCEALARRYDDKTFRDVSQERIAQVLGLACEGGQLLACHDYGQRQIYGHGTERDVAKGAKNVSRACDAGD